MALIEDRYMGPVCLNCKDRNREKQCPNCYNIIYDKSDAIFCVPDCGFCKYFEYEVLISARIGSKVEKIETVKAKEEVKTIIFSYF
jgi:hypothetical protein